MPDILKRNDAMLLGLKRYFTGEPCREGHLSERFCASSICMRCQQEKRKHRPRTVIDREKIRQWRKNNRDKIRESKRRYYERNRESIRARAGQNRSRYLEKIKRKDSEYRRRNIERIKDIQRAYREKRREKLRVLKARYARENREVYRSSNRRYYERNRTKESDRKRQSRAKHWDEVNQKRRVRRFLIRVGANVERMNPVLLGAIEKIIETELLIYKVRREKR